MKKIMLALCTVALSVGAYAADPAAGKAKAAICASCHGKAGIAPAKTFPNLAGQNAPYLVSAMKAYKDKTRSGGQSAMMYGMVAGLSDADIENLAAYYSSLK